MASLSEYFNANRSSPKFFLGDRVYGKWNGIPFVGTVAIDNLVNETEGRIVHIFVDLPIKYKNSWYRQISTRQKNISLLK